jgi:YegS/Rv2252/BmrU family lipid kinase
VTYPLGERPVCVLNPTAGGGLDRSPVENAFSHALGHGRVRLAVTERKGDAERIARDAIRAGATALIAAGGDGTLHGVVNGLVGEESVVPVAALPLGTANDFVRSAGLPADADSTIRALAVAEVRPVDLIRVELEPGTSRSRARVAVNACTGGLPGAVALDASGEQKERWGQLAYARAAFDLLTDEHGPFEVRGRLDDLSVEGRILVAVVANGGRAGGGVPVAPGAEVDDRRLDAVLIREAPLTQILAQLPRLSDEPPEGDAGPLDEPRPVVSRRVREVEIRSRRPMPWSLDGESGSATTARFRVEPGRLRLLIPGSA